MATYKGSTTLNKITTNDSLHSPTTRTIALLNQYGVHLRRFEDTFPETHIPLEQNWNTEHHKLAPPQQLASQKLLIRLFTTGIHNITQLSTPTSKTLLNPSQFQQKYGTYAQLQKSALLSCQIMFCQKALCTSSCSQPCTTPHLTNRLLTPYQTHLPNFPPSPPTQLPHTPPISNPTPVQITRQLHKYPINHILANKPFARTDRQFQISSYTNKYYCQWIFPNNTNYTSWLLEKHVFPYNIPTITHHNTSLLKQYYVHQQNLEYSHILSKHFHQPQLTDSRHIIQPSDLEHVHISLTKCNPDKDMYTQRPIIQTEHDHANIYDATGKYILTIPLSRLQWLWKQYNIYQNKNKYIFPPLQDFETEVLSLYQRYTTHNLSEDHHKNTQYYINTTLLAFLIDMFAIQHSYFSSPITCPTQILYYNSPQLRDHIFGSHGPAFTQANRPQP